MAKVIRAFLVQTWARITWPFYANFYLGWVLNSFLQLSLAAGFE
jgi:hypothetical protein